MSRLLEILDEWDAACFHSDELLSEAYCVFLHALLEASSEDRGDPRVVPFLEVGFEAYSREQDGFDSQPEVAKDMAMAMVGGGQRAAEAQASGEPRPATPPPSKPLWRPWTTSPRRRATSPVAGPSRAAHSQEGLPSSQAPTPRAKRARSASPPAQPTLEVLQSRERYLRRFKATFREEVMQISGLGAALPSEEVMVDLFDTVLARQREALGAQDADRVILEIENAAQADNPLWFSMRRNDQLNGAFILNKVARVLNSNQAFLAEGRLRISCIHVETPEPAGRRTARVPNESMEAWVDRKVKAKHLFSPDNAVDSMCLARSVAVAIAHVIMSKMAYCRMKKPNSAAQRNAAIKLCQGAQIDPDRPCGLDEVRRLQDSLPEYRLCVFTDKKGRECVFKGDFVAGRKNLYLLLHANHFMAVCFPFQAFEARHACERCAVFYENAAGHRWEGSCWRCLGDTEHAEPLRRCNDCGHQFAGADCFDAHKVVKLPLGNKTKCESFKFCQGCERSYSTLRGAQHACGFVYCRYCRQNVRENHLCYMTKWEEKKKDPKWKYITVFYDIETTQNQEVEGKPGTFEHKANMLVTQAVCDLCSDVKQNDYFCTTCKTRQHVFHNLDDPEVNVMGQFIDYLQSFPAKTHLLMVAHNAKAFDGVFVLQEMISRRLRPERILQGAKIICMQLNNWKFIDSLMFLPMALAALPKAFNLTELKKGYWPYLANVPANYEYEGPLLDRELYCVSTMRRGAAAEFNSWYNQQVADGTVFHFRRELQEYAISDVTILREACQAFRKLYEETAGFDPMFHCVTLSSACMAAYRRNFLPEGKIGIVPAGGYHGRGKHSHVALQWLDYESHRLGKVIQTVYTHREVSVLGRPVDGYIELPQPDGSVEKRIFQFHGDYWHQCPLHFPQRVDGSENRLERTMRLTALFRRKGYVVVDKWECAFRREMEEDAEVRAFFAAHPTTRQPPLRLRDALCGGRTSAVRWYHKADLAQGETIKFADIVSEYPSVQMRGMYPFGHPTIFVEGDPAMPAVGEWNGVIKCTVLPPRDLFLPVLPYKAQGKLMFPLCRTCVETGGEALCQHTAALRQLTDTWCAPELQLAVEKGYQVLAVHEVFQYPGTMQYDPDTGEEKDGLFSGYVRRFMALKIQASGWPAGCDTAAQQAEFVAEVKRRDGVVIDPTKVGKNPGLRTLAKLALNSMWGKLAERTIRTKTELVYDYARLMALVSDPTLTVQSLVPLGEACLQVAWKPIEDTEVSRATTSLVHGCFTTCLGRLTLYRYLDIVKDKTLYFDTDSICHISRPGEPDLPLGTCLGQMTDQLAEDSGEGSFITEFAAGGPKNYAYKVAVGGDLTNIKVCVKVRGVSINSSCDELVTFDQLKAMVEGHTAKVAIPIPRQIARLPSWKIVTRSTVKTWRPVNTKRRRVDMARTVPFGFNAHGDDDEEDQEVMEAMELLMDS